LRPVEEVMGINLRFILDGSITIAVYFFVGIKIEPNHRKEDK
jgi:hypothetical protein